MPTQPSYGVGRAQVGQTVPCFGSARDTAHLAISTLKTVGTDGLGWNSQKRNGYYVGRKAKTHLVVILGAIIWLTLCLFLFFFVGTVICIWQEQNPYHTLLLT